MQYQEAVTEFRRLDGEIEADQWRQAQITWEQVEAGKSAREWAGDVGKSDWHIRMLCRVWDARSTSHVGVTISFNDAYQMAGEGTDTPEAAKAKTDLRRANSALGQLPPRAKAEIIREVMKDPDIADQVMEDPAARSHASEAIDRHRTQRDHREHEDFMRDRPEPVSDPFEVLVKFRSLHRTLTEIAALIASRGGVSAEARDALLEECDWLANALGMIRDGVRGGNVDAAIDAILAEAGD